MTYLLDTHVLLWAVQSPDLISRNVLELLSKDWRVLVSVASFWEIALKIRTGKLDIKNPGLLLFEQVRLLKAEILPVQADHALRTLDLPFLHKDPFDRLLVAQAIVENAILITRDPVMKNYPIVTLW